ncbi:chromosome segregation protein SMC [Thermoflexibacter ruber]|uniref:Chromosome partition protein Smc n=1 Tax=Thermoflexibacter ruber TaxID=1003 RepID=A0A1I2FBL6_9BACT|nr:chromosome segregation protein SMC [Thermoflexibacter ruber]SFF01921.1 condensin subunit Smc [Thermoflexibacter ruber]
MQLSKLEIRGFKSFGDKVTIHFEEGVTGIVGPNGCGKSNVVDAIRWALGEQSTKSLRSDKMENIIFNGTKNRKPLQMAEVSLTFNNNHKGSFLRDKTQKMDSIDKERVVSEDTDNGKNNQQPTTNNNLKQSQTTSNNEQLTTNNQQSSTINQYSEIVVTRRYYRTGEGEYLLNGVPCRLKDINNLFLDTGIGADSYAIIELKMVDEILNDTHGERRSLFEEAAGISKFKVRKKETMKKLGEADADLERVEDLLFEIDKNLKTLEKQAKQAERYFKTKEEYKNLSIELAKKVVFQQRERLISLNQQITQESDKKLALQIQIEAKEAEIEALQLDILNKEKLFSSRQKTLNDHINRIRQYESEKKIKSERLKYLQDRKQNIENQQRTEKDNIEKIQLQIQQISQEEKSANRQLAEAEAHLANLKADYEKQKQVVQEIQKEVSELNLQIKSKQENVFQVKKVLEIKQIQYNSLRIDLEKNLSGDSEFQDNIDRFTDEIVALKEEISEKENELNNLLQKEEELKEQITDLQAEIEEIREDFAKNSRKLDALQNEYNLTKSLIDNFEGFPEGVKFLKQNVSYIKNAPFLSDIFTCEEKYKIAIENFLQSRMNYFIVETQEQAFQAVNLLNEASQGKANFFVLEDAEKIFNNNPSKILYALNAESEGSMIPAIRLIECEDKYFPLMSLLLENVYIVNEAPPLPPPSEGGNVSSENNFTSPFGGKEGGVFISLNGKVIRRKYSVSGGSVGLFEGKRIGRVKNLENLSKEIGELKKLIQNHEQSIERKVYHLQKLKEATQNEAITKLQAEIAKVQQALVSAKIRQEQQYEQSKRQKMKVEEMQEQLAILKDEIIDSEPLVTATQQALSEMEHQLSEKNQVLFAQNDLLSQKSTIYNEKNIAFYQLKNKVDSFSKELAYKELELEKTQKRIDTFSQELSQFEKEILQLKDSILSTEEDDYLLRLYDERDSIEAGVKESERAYYHARGEVVEIEKLIRELRRSKDIADALLNELQNKLSESRLQLSAVKERLSVEFEIDLEAIMQAEDVQISPLTEEYLREEVKKAKERLEKIGQVNPMAMEAYNEIKQRYDFIISQKEDLLHAKNSLIQTITEIDTVARQNFTEAFQKIRTNFIEVFRSLFTEEDTCDLILSDPENPLEADIDIVAKPKGKRPLTINQLSGGEKTLTAVSLLFAIYLLRPAPFCIFDEVDAPLDDANIDKFNNIIKRFADYSQFIIVTHNKRTMATTDVIYGVTMLEQGVSTVVPVDLRELA